MKFSWLIFVDLVLYFFFAMRGDKPKEEAPTPMEAPTTEIGAPIGVLAGTRMIKEPKIGWWGDVKIVKIKVNSDSKK